MDINLVRSLVTIVSLALFIGLVIRTWTPARRADHEQASRLLFDGEAGFDDERGS